MCRSPLPGASIFPTDPLSQPCPRRIFFVLEAPPTGVFAGVFIIANHKRAAVLYCYKSNAATRKYFNNGGRRRYHSSKNKKIPDRVDSCVQFGWRLRVMGSNQCVIVNSQVVQFLFKNIPSYRTSLKCDKPVSHIYAKEIICCILR